MIHKIILYVQHRRVLLCFATCWSTSGSILRSFCWHSVGSIENVCLLMSARRLVLTRMESGVSTSISHFVRLSGPENPRRGISYGISCADTNYSDLWRYSLALSLLVRWDTFRAPVVWHTSALTEEDELEVEFCGLAGQRSVCFSSQARANRDMLFNIHFVFIWIWSGGQKLNWIQLKSRL